MIVRNSPTQPNFVKPGDNKNEIPKASPESAALGIFDGLEKGEEDIFPDPASQSMAEGWRTGVAKALERQYAAFVQESAANLE
jgi:hypothetical protein